MISPPMRCRVLFCCILAMLLSSRAFAHPLASDDGTPAAEAGEVSTLAGTRPAGLGHGPEGTHSRTTNDGHSDSPPNASPGNTRGQAVAWFGQVQPNPETGPALAGVEEAELVKGSLRAWANPRSQRTVARPLQNQAPFAQEATPEAVAEIAATLQELQQSAAEVLGTALDARFDREGKVTFSLAGVEGFRVDPHGGEVSFGYGDASLSILRFGPGADDAQPEQISSRSQQANAAPAPPSLGQEIVAILREVFQYPLAWLVILLLLIGKVALVIANRRGRRRMHRRRSRSQTVKVKRTRIRHRVRIKRLPNTPSFQKL